MKLVKVYTKSQGGFLIIEAAIAFLLVSLGMIGLMMLSAKGSRASQENFERTEAVNLATQIVAKVRSSGDGLAEWHNVDVANSSTWTSSNAATLEALTSLKKITDDRLSNAAARVTLLAVDGVSVCAAAPCSVQVDVTWTGALQKPLSYSLSGWTGIQL